MRRLGAPQQADPAFFLPLDVRGRVYVHPHGPPGRGGTLGTLSLSLSLLLQWQQHIAFYQHRGKNVDLYDCIDATYMYIIMYPILTCTVQVLRSIPTVSNPNLLSQYHDLKLEVAFPARTNCGWHVSQSEKTLPEEGPCAVLFLSPVSCLARTHLAVAS